MPPDEDGGGRGHGLAMLRLEARRYKREMQQIWMQRQLYEQKKSTSSLSSEDSARLRNDRWRLSDTLTTSSATSVTPMFWNREDVPVSRLEQLAIVEEGTQTDSPSKSEVQTETEKLQYDEVISSRRESGTVSSAVNNISMLETCSRHCDELRSRVSQEAACECLAEAAGRVNADVLFTAKPKRVTVEGPVEVLGDNYSKAFRSAEIGIGERTSTVATSPTGSLNKGQKSTDPVQDLTTGLRNFVSPVLRHDSACSPIPNLIECEAKFKRLGDTIKVTERFPCSREKSAPERSSTLTPPPLSTQVSTPQPDASRGVTKAGDNGPDSSTEIGGSKRRRNESIGEGVVAARLATNIKHALEAIGGNADSRSASSIFNLPGRAIQSTSACRLHHKDQCPEMKLFDNVGESFEDRPLNGKEISSNDSSLRETCHHSRAVCVSSGQHHTNSAPCSDTDIYFHNVMDALCIDRSASNKLSGNCIPGEVSAARAAQRAERRPEASRRANVKSCGDHHASHQAVGLEKSVKTGVRQSGIKHVMEKQRLLSNVQKLQNVAETAKRLYTDLVDCAYDELRSSTDCGNLVKHQGWGEARDVFKFTKSEFCPSTEIISAHRADVVSTDNNEVCGRCFVCQPRLCNEQPPEESQTGSLDEITIELSDASPTNIIVSRNDCKDRPRYNVEVSTPCELPYQRVSSPNNRCGNTVRRQSASWKDACKPAIRRTRPTVPSSNQQVKTGFKKCLLGPHCDGPRDCCHMPTRVKCSRPSTVSITSPKRSSTTCLLDPRCDGPRNRCHMPTRAKSSGVTTVCVSPPKKSNKYLSNSCCDSPRNSCHTPTREDCSGATTVCIDPPKKDSNMCCLDPCCVGSRNSCHMPTYSKSSRASCGLGGSSHIKRSNGTKWGNKNPSGLSQCLVRRSRRMEPVKGNLERNPCRGRVQSAHPNNLDDENHGHLFLHNRKHNGPTRHCRDISKLPEVLDKISKVDSLREARNQENVCVTHNDLRSSSIQGKEIKVGTGGHEETAGLHYSSSERMDLNNPVKNVHRSIQECSRIGVAKNLSTLTATGDIEKETASIGKETRQPTAQHTTSITSALTEAYTQTTLLNPPSDNVNRAVAAAGLASEIEVIVADQPGKSSRKIKQSNYLTSHRKLSKGQNGSFGQTKLDVPVIAAANAVKKLKPISLLPLVKRDEGNQKATPRKGPTPRAKLMADDTIGSSFYDQMYKELEQLSSERMQLVRQERTQFPFESLFFPHQDDRHAGFFIRRRSSSDLKSLTNAGSSELGHSTRSVRMQRSEESPRLWHEPISSHTPGSKRQRSATSPAKEHCNKLLRLSVWKAESQADRRRQDQHSTFSVSLDQAVAKSNKSTDKVCLINLKTLSSEFSRKKGRSVSEQDIEKLNDASSEHLGLASAYRMSTSSAGRWKPALEEAQAKTTTKRKFLAARKVRPPTWVERMSKAKNVFSSLIRPLLLARFGKEQQLEANVRREASQSPGLMFRSSLISKHFGKRIPGGKGFTLVHPNALKIHGKKFIKPNQYDIYTGRKIAHADREPGELLRLRVENQQVRPSSESLHEMTRLPIVKRGRMSSAVTTLNGNLGNVRGWNADPSIRSDIPHKIADVIRYNRNGGLNTQIRGRNAGGRDKSSTGTSTRQMTIRHVTFAGLVVQNSRNEKIRKDSIALQSTNSREPQVVAKKASASQSSRARRTSGKRHSSSAPKIPPTQGKSQRYGGGSGKWTYHEGFWTEMFDSELKKVSPDNSLQSLLTPGSIAQPGTPSIELRTAQVLDTLSGPALSTDLLTGDPSSVVKRTNDGDVTGCSAGERNFSEEHGRSSATNFELRNGSDVQRSSEFTNENGEPQNLNLSKCLGLFRADGFEDDAIVDHRTAVATEVLLSTSQFTEEGERAESNSETKPKNLSEMQAQVNIVNRIDQDMETLGPILSSEEFPHSPLRLLDEVFPDSTENEALVSMFDRLQVATFALGEAHSEKGHKAAECVTPKTCFDTSYHENEALLKNLELERTLVDLALHTILHDDYLKPSGIPVPGVEPISLPINRRLAMRADKEVEAIVHARDMSQSPLSKAIPCVDRSTEQDIISHVDRATELENYSLFSKDQDSQTVDADFGVPNIQGFKFPTQEKCGSKLKNTQVHHQATECRVPWNAAGIQMPDTTPILMPVFFPQLGTNMLPIVFPTVNFSTSSNLQSRPVGTVSGSFQDQGTQATESQIQLIPRVITGVSKLPISTRAVLGQRGVREEENASDREEEEPTRGSSPSTPSTPLSSPDHKLSLRKALQLSPDMCSVQEFTAFARKDPEPVVSEVCEESRNGCLQAHQTNELTPPIQVETDSLMEEITNADPSVIASANETRRGTSWAKVKEMEEAALTLLRTASMKTPSATSSSECSQENSPEVSSSMSPGEVNTEDFRSRAGRRFVGNSHASQENWGKLNHSHAWSWLSCGRTSIGEVYNPVLLGPLSEGEIEAGVVPSIGELGQVQNERSLSSHPKTDLQGQGSEPGEIQIDPDASSPHESQTHQMESSPSPRHPN